MNAIESISGLSDLTLASKTKEEPKSNELGRDAFLELMITQMENQDPLSPKDNSSMVAELAQFSSVENLDQLNNSFDVLSRSLLSGQALQATSLVGTSVTVPGSEASLRLNDVVSGSITVPFSTNDMSVNIYDESGSLVDQVPVGLQPAGETVFRWDGYNMEINGEMMDWQSNNEEGLPPGAYKFEVMASQSGENTQLETALSANVNSVTVGDDGKLTINLAGIGPVSMSDIKQYN
jgi:flagellar basal-body rod modification protein FlgD